ncbi:MAG: phosphatase PAP2 family protein [Spirulinaceae cyanobacterium]
MTVIEWLQSGLGTSWQNLFIAITYVGSDYAYIVLLSVYYWLIDPISGRKLGMLMGLTYGLNLLLKEIINRPRPFEINPNIALESLQKTSESTSFPSGHAQGSATFWFYLAAVYQKSWLWWFSGILVFLVSLSRVYLGVHYLGDVVAGIILGGLLAWGGWRWQVSQKPALQFKIICISVTVILATVFPQFSRSLAVFTGFFIAQFQFRPPTTIKSRFTVAIAGLLLALCYYFLSEIFLSESWAYWRYLGLALLVTEAYPRLAKRCQGLS